MKTINDYAELVKEKHALNKTIAPVEADETDASRAYAVGEQLIFNGTLYDVIVPISQHDVITTTGSGANIAPAGSISAKIQALTNKVRGNWATGGVNLLTFDFEAIKAINVVGTWNGNVYTRGGATFTVNADGTVTKSGTASELSQFFTNNISLPAGTYKLVGCPKGGSFTTYDIRYTNNYVDFGDGVEFTLAQATDNINIALTARANDPTTVTYKPMISSNLNVTYDDFAPYAKTNRELTVENEALTNELADEVSYDAETGVKNLYNYSLVSGTESQGITYTINADKSILAKGTASVASATFGLGKVSLKAGTYKFSCVAPSSARARVLDENASPVTVLGTDEGSGVEFTLASDNDNITVQLIFNQSFGEYNAVIKPMITKANIPNSDYAHYVPYAMTNRELTEKINEEFLQNTASISAQINYKDVYLFTTNGGSSSGSAQYSSAYLVLGQATTQITYFALKEGTEITPSVDGTTFTLTASTSITMAYRKL